MEPQLDKRESPWDRFVAFFFGVDALLNLLTVLGLLAALVATAWALL